MCNFCGKVLRVDTLKRHVNAKHGNIAFQQKDDSLPTPMVEKCTIDHWKNGNSFNDANESNGNLDFELRHDNETYKRM